jgi:hypothetical protein
VPDPQDERLHPPTADEWWNESFYFDGVSDDGGLGVYARSGRVTNQGQALIVASVVGPGRPSLMLVVSGAPLPDTADETQTVDVPGLHFEQHCLEPLKRFNVRIEGAAQRHADPSAPLRGVRGEPAEIAFDLVWATAGIPYAWRRATRYEIPCRVSGAVRIGDEEVQFAGPGQRDHSWGPRDWFAVDWMWCALHLDDGSHVHAVGIPRIPGYGVGYVQKDGRLEELESVRAREEVAEDGLITRAEVTLDPVGLALEIEPVSFGAVLFTAPDGRTSHFPRAMCRVSTSDGRRGAGWIEWNRNNPG